MSTQQQGNTEIDPDVLNELVEAFKLFDKENDETISPSNLGTVMQSLGSNPTDEELIMLIAQIDENDKNDVDFPEFLKAMVAKDQDQSEEEQELLLHEAFKIFDKVDKTTVSVLWLHIFSSNLLPFFLPFLSLCQGG